MSNDVRKTLQLISDMRIMPLQQAGVLEMFPVGDLTFELGKDLYSYEFLMDDSVEAIFNKYFRIHDHLSPDIKSHVFSVISSEKATGTLGEAFDDFVTDELRDMG